MCSRTDSESIVFGVPGDELEDLHVLLCIQDHQVNHQLPERDVPERPESLAQSLQVDAVLFLGVEQTLRLFGQGCIPGIPVSHIREHGIGVLADQTPSNGAGHLNEKVVVPPLVLEF